jgi:DNA-binding transcriptional ArsR family regulator
VPEQDGELTQLQAATIRALANTHRLRIVGILREGPREVNEITRSVALGQAAVSQHLAVMRAAGLVSATRDGRLVRYRLTDPSIGVAREPHAALGRPTPRPARESHPAHSPQVTAP